jgi:hypothetical protein
MRTIAVAFTIAAGLVRVAFAQPAAGDVDRVIRFTNIESVQDLAEVSTTIRAISDTQYVPHAEQPQALLLRGTASQIELAAWIAAELDNPDPQRIRNTRCPAGLKT